MHNYILLWYYFTHETVVISWLFELVVNNRPKNQPTDWLTDGLTDRPTNQHYYLFNCIFWTSYSLQKLSNAKLQEYPCSSHLLLSFAWLFNNRERKVIPPRKKREGMIDLSFTVFAWSYEYTFMVFLSIL